LSVSLLHLLGQQAVMDREAIGGKAASLDRMSSLGLPTPPGFCLTVHAHALYLSGNDLQPSVERLQRRLPEEAARSQLEQLMFTAPMPRRLCRCLERGLQALAAQCDSVAQLAVRSSAPHEDGALVSFAGQHETILGVSPDDLEDAVRRCWASLWSRRAAAYRCARRLPFNGELMAVVVQPLLAATASAVVFTKSPLAFAEGELVIAVISGLGEPLVSGAADACTITVDRPTLSVLSVEGFAGAETGAQRESSAVGGPTGRGPSAGASSGGRASGGAQARGGAQASREARAGEAAIDDDAIVRLAELSLRVERELGMPIDLEAALVGREWWLLQARPITTMTQPISLSG
jgi:phosphoenolpyruvate synthase/pyruvate phosphate dikinase